MAKIPKKKLKRKTSVKKKPKRKVAKKTKPRAGDKPRAKVPKIWHIFLFGERFELSEDSRGFRTSPLEFVREFVGSGLNDRGIKYGHQIDKIKRSPNRHILRSAFTDLRDVAANRSKCYRGYLLNVKDEPASEKEIAHWVGLTLAECRKAIKELEDIGLIERVPVPEWDLLKNEKPPKRSDSPDQSGPVQASPGQSGRARAPFKKTGNGTETGNPKDKKKRKTETKTGTPAVPAFPETQPKTEAETQERKQMLLKQLEQGKGNGNHPTPDHHPSALDSDTGPGSGSPTDSDAREGKQQASSLSSPPSSFFDSDTDKYLDSVLNDKTGCYSQAAKEFGCLVYTELKVPYEPTSAEGKCELANFATAWDKASSSGLSPPVLDELWRKGLADATKIGGKRHKTNFIRNAQATWRDMFNRRLRARKARMKTGKPP